MKILEVLTKRRKIGNYGEKMAARHLKRSGYRIRERNFVAGDAEIDLIAENREVLAFIEVKTRTLGHESPKEPRPASAVDCKKQRKILSASRFYPSFYRSGKHVRYDIIEVYLENTEKPHIHEIKHLKGAFDGDTAYRRKL